MLEGHEHERGSGSSPTFDRIEGHDLTLGFGVDLFRSLVFESPDGCCGINYARSARTRKAGFTE